MAVTQGCQISLDQQSILCTGKQILNHRTTREAPRVTITTLVSGVFLCLKTESTPSYQATRAS